MLEYDLFQDSLREIEQSSSQIFIKSLERLAPVIEKLFQKLKRKGCTSYEKKRSAPGDQLGWVGKTPLGHDCLYLSNRNCLSYNYIIIFLEKSKEKNHFECYKYYADVSVENKENNNYLENIQYADILMSYTDNINNNRFVSRPNLQYLFDNLEDILEHKKFFHFEKLFAYVQFKENKNLDKEKYKAIKSLQSTINQTKNREIVWDLKDIAMVGDIATLLIYDLTRTDV